ncbi:MAG: hypothetical protein J6O23_02205 [Prevotella sp.]|nr:hypothetical protein [Prevotella sp.]
MKQIQSERVFLNMAGKESSQTVRLTLHLRDAVDGAVLKEAVEATRQRYPYHQVRLCTVSDEQGMPHYAFDDNPLPWVLTAGRQQVTLLSEAANHHLLAFAWWDDCIALDWFYPLTDGTGAYRILRTLLYEYCRRRYDSTLNSAGIPVAGDDISEEETVDPLTLPRRENVTPQSVPDKPKALNLFTDAVVPLREDGREVIHIRVPEHELMERVRSFGATPASLFSVLLSRAISRLHPDFSGGVPTISLAVNLRKATGTPLAHQPMVGAVTIPFREEMLGRSLEEQVSDCRQWIAVQNNPDNLLAYYYGMHDGMARLEQVPSLAMRHQLLTEAHQALRQHATVSLSYVGRAAMGAAERYVREVQTEATSLHAILVEVSAAGGTFCISFMQLFTVDNYLNAFLDELRQQGIGYEITDRHKVMLAPISDYRKDW